MTANHIWKRVLNYWGDDITVYSLTSTLKFSFIFMVVLLTVSTVTFWADLQFGNVLLNQQSFVENEREGLLLLLCLSVPVCVIGEFAICFVLWISSVAARKLLRTEA